MTTITAAEADEVAREAARRVVDATSTLAPYLRLNLALALAGERSTTLSSIGTGLLSKDPVARIARSLKFECLIGDAEEIAPKLGTSEPWNTIRSALEDTTAAWRAAHPGWRTANDHRSMWLQWEQEALDRAAAAVLLEADG